jgi:hypothetical protein
MFERKDFREKFKEAENLKITIIITGPIATGHYDYFESLVKEFKNRLLEMPEEYRSKFYLAFLFSELDKNKFKQRFDNPSGIPELYNISSLVLLPSETEGRGLPILEAAACGVPIFCCRYFPEDVYSEVIGEDLPEEDRLRVIEFDGIHIGKKHIEKIVERVFFPHKHVEEIAHNQKVVQKRFSLESLNKDMEAIIYRLYLQLRPSEETGKNAGLMLKNHRRAWVDEKNRELKKLIHSGSKHHLPGFGRLSFMIFLKSLIDPSYFRVEEQYIRGMAYKYALGLFKANTRLIDYNEELWVEYLNTIDHIFKYKEGKIGIQHDHSLAYRHRNKYNYPYRSFTLQELTGIFNEVYSLLFPIKPEKVIDKKIHFFTDWNLALAQMTSSSSLAIDDRLVLFEKMKSNLPIALFTGRYVNHELEFFALQAIRSRLNLNLQEELTEVMFDEAGSNQQPIYVFIQKNSIFGLPTADEIRDYIESGISEELRILYRKGIVSLVETEQKCMGIHFQQLGKNALKKLISIRDAGGYLISQREGTAMMTDFVDIDRFHIGRAEDEITANVMGIPMESGYIQFVPAGLRTTLAYPSPVQTAYDFHKAMNSDQFKKLSQQLGQGRLLEAMRKDSLLQGSPIQYVLDNLDHKSKGVNLVEYRHVNGIYHDKMPWSGVLARTKPPAPDKKWSFRATYSKEGTQRVTKFVSDFEKSHNIIAEIAWNGGYILNPELVGKLGLPEEYIGSPLGLLITDGKMKSAPLFNKPALLVSKDGSLEIRRVSSAGGITLEYNGNIIHISKKHYNIVNPGNEPAYYDLMFEKGKISGDGRVLLRLAGNIIKEVRKTKPGEKIDIIPVGITITLPPGKKYNLLYETEKEVDIKLEGLEEFEYGIEAGPLLLENGDNAIDMDKGGWKNDFSIKTQAARLDYTDMRGPKIAIGLDGDKNLLVLAINGRIRESVGATHLDMAEILLANGALQAMGFDPGGSSTLVVRGRVLNISPYNSHYEKNIFSLPPEPRAVANAVIGYVSEINS